MVKFSAAIRAENWRSPQYISSAPAAMAAKNAVLLPAGARIKGREGICVSLFIMEGSGFKGSRVQGSVFTVYGLTATITLSKGIIKLNGE
jgi:hypothetical protein